MFTLKRVLSAQMWCIIHNRWKCASVKSYKLQFLGFQSCKIDELKTSSISSIDQPKKEKAYVQSSHKLELR